MTYVSMINQGYNYYQLALLMYLSFILGAVQGSSFAAIGRGVQSTPLPLCHRLQITSLWLLPSNPEIADAGFLPASHVP